MTLVRDGVLPLTSWISTASLPVRPTSGNLSSAVPKISAGVEPVRVRQRMVWLARLSAISSSLSCIVEQTVLLFAVYPKMAGRLARRYTPGERHVLAVPAINVNMVQAICRRYKPCHVGRKAQLVGIYHSPPVRCTSTVFGSMHVSESDKALATITDFSSGVS
jgi:hypothetical protein